MQRVYVAYQCPALPSRTHSCLPRTWSPAPQEFHYLWTAPLEAAAILALLGYLTSDAMLPGLAVLFIVSTAVQLFSRTAMLLRAHMDTGLQHCRQVPFASCQGMSTDAQDFQVCRHSSGWVTSLLAAACTRQTLLLHAGGALSGAWLPPAALATCSDTHTRFPGN